MSETPFSRSPAPPTAHGATDELDLPPLDGEGDEGEATYGDDETEIEDPRDKGDPLDDATGEGDPLDDLVVEGAEAGWLVEDEEGAGLDVGPFDLSLGHEDALIEQGDEPEALTADEDLAAGEETVHADGGEEGPLAQDEELREEDLPALDADEDGDVEEEALYDRALLGHDDELRWDDRAWQRVPESVLADGEDGDDSGMLAVPGEDPKQVARDAMWRKLDESGRVTAATLVPGGSIVVALESPERPVLVRILAGGAARIIAEIETSGAEEDDGVCRVTALKWDGGRGCLLALGTFGVQVFRPA